MGAVKFRKVECIPQWADPYFVNGDASGLSEADLREIREFEDRLVKEGLRLVCPIEGTETEMCWAPAFGGCGASVSDYTAEVIQPTRVIFRKKFWKDQKEWQVIAFFPDVEANFGMVQSYVHDGQHGEASIEFYHSTRKCSRQEYEALRKELEDVVGYGPVRVMKRFPRKMPWEAKKGGQHGDE